MVTRCIENRVFAVTANRVGIEKRGDVAPCLDLVEIDLYLADNKMINPYNDVLTDRRPEFY